jgi:hypothetical protein
MQVDHYSWYEGGQTMFLALPMWYWIMIAVLVVIVVVGLVMRKKEA